MALKNFVQQTFCSLDEKIVDQKVSELVNQLKTKKYKLIKVKVCSPVTHSYSDGSTSIEFITIVTASLDGKIILE
ncbi:hypothetical protein A2572_04300 [Candidatus Collierbacteria bacterium RIFOXYD1_FULL_40_9]|uniref:Uncharacterized protein n=1 Tax=Candidatus Collierbacteria bacterium RIFOXYD1_FULL_40_9 TaxID=1817731 RepID=A0A1F5FPL8_9BACT|nr:MAG: hypothetical protein A2572_04300 [Candidatus Collierbacteria bacterium RIFOXYD1_FULL_40_9]